MARRPDDHLSALCLPIVPEAWLEDIAPNTGGDDSSYTESGPRPGRAVPDQATARLRPVLSGEQSVDLELVTLTGGHATLDTFGAVQVGYRLGGEAASATRGWTAPNWVSGWSAPAWTTTDTYRHAAAVVPATQAIVATYRSTGGGARYAITWDPSTATWGSAVEIRSSGSDADVIVAEPGGRRLVATTENRSYRSDDDGATWTLHSLGVWPPTHTPSTYDRARAAWGADGTILAIAEITASATLLQLASSDTLSTWSVVGSSGGMGLHPAVAALPQGGFLVAYARDADDHIVVRRLAHAYDPIDDAAEVVAVAAASSDVALTVDPDGLVWLHHSPSPADGTVEVSVSIDGGTTWTALDEGAIKGLATGDSAITDYVGVPCEGAVMLLGHPDSSTNSAADGSVVAVRLGGWSTLPASSPEWTDARDWTSRSGHGTGGGSSAVWLPGELPGNNGWTVAGAAGETFLSDGRLRVLGTGADARSYSRTGITSTGPATVVAELSVPQDGSVTANDVAIDRWVSWTGHEYRIVVRFSETQIRVRDASAGTTLATVDYDCTAPFLITILLSTSSVDSGVWVRRPEETAWTSVWTGDLTDNTTTPTGSGGLEWANISASSSMSVWSFVADSQLGVVGNGTGATPAVGRPLTALPVPLPAETGRAWLAATSGPGALGETFAADAGYDYPVEAVLPTVSPSPAVRWRSTSTAEQVIAWDHGRRLFTGDSIALTAIGANFRLAHLEHSDGSGWTTAGTLDLAQGFVGLSADLVGRTLTPATGTTEGARYLAEGELAECTVVFVTGADARRIVWNTAGWWGGTGPQTRLVLDGLDGTESTAGGVQILWSSGVLVCHPAAVQVRSRWRVRIPASQPTVDGWYSAGVLVPSGVRLIGQAPEWGWSREAEPNATTTTSRRGTTRTQSVGPLRRTWSMSWSSGADQFDLRNGAVRDWLSPDEHDRGVAWQDVPRLLEGLLVGSASGEVPVVALAVVPADGETLTDPSLWLYGRLSSSVRQDHLVGTEGESEVIRVGELVVREVV